MSRFKRAVHEHLSESLRAVLPVVLIIVALCFSIAPLPNSTFLGFLVGAALLLLGMSLFNLGVQQAMIPIGERIGAYITKSRKLWLLILVALLIGISITVSEPDLQVLAQQIPSVPNTVLVISIAVGVGLFLVVALLRMLLYVPINQILIVCYALVFALAFFVPHEYLAIAFDAGGVTTGPMTVPFILSLGLGVASIRSDKHAANDSFGLVGLSSIGPILTVMILGLIYPSNGSHATELLSPEADNSRELWMYFFAPESGFLHQAKEVAEALFPIILFFLVFQIVAFRIKRRPLAKILIGLLYTFVGLVLFLTGVNVGFMPAGRDLGAVLAQLPYRWVLVPVAMLIGYFLISAEPAVAVLNRQVEEISAGAIPTQVMRAGLAIGMSVSLGLSMLRLLLHIPILWFLLPGYVLALVLSFFVPKIFTAIAFDSGGVASGPMTATFLLPFAIGVCNALDGSVATDAFGVVAMVAMTPLITIQIMGMIYKIRLKRMPKGDDTQDMGIIE
ncbi:MAG: DUF1538 domain-containing protein [Oscillospiraceae bacterium]|jgi:hypothetical protein|nr:DUF1538 domain-containing protein [Oscillospiraceae bacterium]